MRHKYRFTDVAPTPMQYKCASAVFFDEGTIGRFAALIARLRSRRFQKLRSGSPEGCIGLFGTGLFDFNLGGPLKD